MLNIHKETTEDGAILLKLTGDVTIDSAEQLRQCLLTELQAAEQLEVDCSQTRSIDLYCIQLLCSAHRSSVAWNKQFSFYGTPAEPVIEAIEKTGFLRELGCSLCPEDVRCMWSGHHNPSDN